MKQNAETAVERFSCFGSVLAYFHCAGASSVELNLRDERTNGRFDVSVRGVHPGGGPSWGGTNRDAS